MIRDSAVYMAYSAGWQAVRHLPDRAAYGMFQRIADQQWRARGAGVRRLEANLARALGRVDHEELRAASREGMRSYMRYWCDAFRLPGWDDERINAFRLHGVERIASHLAAGRGVVLALPHMGNWDHAGAMVSRTVAPVTTVAERLEPERLYRAFVDYRTGLGMHIHGLGEPGVYEKLRATVEGGGLVALLADRDLSSRGVGVTLLGEPARFPPGPAALAVDSGGVLMPISLYWDGTVNAGQLHDPVVVPSDGERADRISEVSQALADVFTREIAAHPTDWHMLQRVFLADLDPARLAASDARGDG